MADAERRRFVFSCALAHPALAPLVELVLSASASRTPLRVRGGDTKAFHGSPAHGLPVLDTRDLSGVVAYEPTELVITALAGEVLSLPIELSIDPEKLPSSTNEITFRLHSADDPSIKTDAASRFIGPSVR